MAAKVCSKQRYSREEVLLTEQVTY